MIEIVFFQRSKNAAQKVQIRFNYFWFQVFSNQFLLGNFLKQSCRRQHKFRYKKFFETCQYSAVTQLLSLIPFSIRFHNFLLYNSSTTR